MSLVPSVTVTPVKDQMLSLGELRATGRARGDSEKKALFYLLKQTQDAAMRHEKHQAVMSDPAFLGFCEEKKTKPTTRQARKFLRRKRK